MRYIFAFSLLLSLLPVLARADQFDDGYSAFQVGETEKALKILQPLAEEGCPDAQELLGEIYVDWGDAIDVSQSEAQTYNAKARHWFFKAANQGNAEAQKTLVWMYEQGWGGKPDLVKAYKWALIAVTSSKVSAGDSLHTLKTKMTPKQVAQARHLAANWKQIPSRFPLLCARMQADLGPTAVEKK